MSEMLEAEVQTYERRRAEFLQGHEGKYVLIRQDTVAGFFDSERDAIVQGYKQFGYVPFLVKRVEALEVPLDFACSTLVM